MNVSGVMTDCPTLLSEWLKTNAIDANSFNIVHSNVDGFISHADNINEFIGHKKNATIDVYCVTETLIEDDLG